jgi:HlyD family secretion protein
VSRRAWVAILGAVVALAAAVWIGRTVTAGDVSRTATVHRGDLVLSVEVEGVLSAVEASRITPPPIRDVWEFKITSLTPEGQEVQQGAPVVSFDANDLRQRLERQRAESDAARKQIEKTEKNLAVSRESDELRVAEAEGRLRRAELTLDAPPEIVKAQELALERLDLDLARLELKFLRERSAAAKRSAEAQLAALHNQLDRAVNRAEEIEAEIERMTRRAPRAGTVIHITNWDGTKPKIGDSVWRGREIVELPDLRTMRADGRVDEADAGRLSVGQRVTLKLDAHPDVDFHGRVASIWNTVQRASWNSPLKVAMLAIELDETDSRRMRPGMRFRGRIEIERAPGVLLAPAGAVFASSDGPVVYRQSLTGFERVRVEVGRRNATDVEVLRGLDENDRIGLTEPQDEDRG